MKNICQNISALTQLTCRVGKFIVIWGWWGMELPYAYLAASMVSTNWMPVVSTPPYPSCDLEQPRCLKHCQSSSKGTEGLEQNDQLGTTGIYRHCNVT